MFELIIQVAIIWDPFKRNMMKVQPNHDSTKLTGGLIEKGYYSGQEILKTSRANTGTLCPPSASTLWILIMDPIVIKNNDGV